LNLNTRAAAVLLCFPLAACFYAKADGELLRSDLDALKIDLATQKTDREKSDKEMAARLAEMQTVLDRLDRVARKSGADLGVDLEKAQNDIAQIRGQLEVLQHKLGETDAGNAQRDQRIEEATRFIQTKQKQLDTAEHPTDKAAIYALGRKKLEAGESVRARELFVEFLSKFHADELAPNAQYWLGETFYAEKRFNDAIVEFQKILKEWPSSEKEPDALLKIGMAFQAQDDCKNALLFFDAVVNGKKSSPAAHTAKEKAAACKKGKR